MTHGSHILPPGYEYRRTLGAGSSAEVILAHEVSLRRLVALKRVDADIVGDGLARQMAIQEGRMLARLRSPFIAGVFDIREDPAGLWLVMEYVPGRTLQDLLDAGADIPLSTGLMWSSEIALALDEAGRQGVIHRDLKPGNVIINRKWHCRVVDFGIAVTSAASSTGEIVGTPAYMSPEQVRGTVVTPASDVYSLGLISYLLTTGQHPFLSGTESPQDLMAAQVSVAPANARSVRSSVPRNAAKAIAAALDKRVDRRPSPARLAAELQRALAKVTN